MRSAPAKPKQRLTAREILARLQKSPDPLVRQWAARLATGKELKAK